MRRRDALNLLGTAAAGLAAGHTEAVAADPHEGANAAGQFHLYLCAFHIAKKDPTFQVEAHHFCSAVSDEVHQCVIFDSREKNARILGVEYIISDRLYRGLPEAEKKSYHPHTYEILSGVLAAPELADDAETALMGKLLTTWGKTWHTWPDPRTPLPMGDPLLMWSYSRDGQADPDLIARRDRAQNISTPARRRRRAALGPVPQVSPPRSLDALGRQWTDEGPDEPPRP